MNNEFVVAQMRHVAQGGGLGTGCKLWVHLSYAVCRPSVSRPLHLVCFPSRAVEDPPYTWVARRVLALPLWNSCPRRTALRGLRSVAALSGAEGELVRTASCAAKLDAGFQWFCKHHASYG